MTTPPERDPYAALAPMYDAWQACFGSFTNTVLPRLEAELQELGATGEPFSFLDLGCGTGSLLLALHQRHPDWRLAGLDASSAMLAQAREKPGARAVNWVHAPFERAPELGTFRAAGSFYDALNHLADGEALGRALAGAAAALVPGGLLCFDVNNREGYQAWWRHNERFAGPGWELVVETTFDGREGRGRARGRVRWANDRHPAAQLQLEERCFSPAEIASALAAAGLALEREEPWSVAPGAVAGKTWYVARKR
jgi:SAM-dependent methyltransferase